VLAFCNSTCAVTCYDELFPLLRQEGFTDTFIQEMDQQGAQVYDHCEYPGGRFLVQHTSFVHLPPIEATLDWHHLSMAAGMQPSPDWFTGFCSFWLIDEYSQTWCDHIKIQTKPWDAGTDTGSAHESLDNDLDPPQHVQLAHMDATYSHVGELECFLVLGATNVDMPECDWFANPFATRQTLSTAELFSRMVPRVL